VLLIAMHGATGVQSSFCQIAGERTTRQLVAQVGARLGLPVPPICPHHRTDRFAELGFVLAGILSTLGEAGLEIRDLQRSEVGEIAEPWGDAQHSSSTMPQKQNPEVSEWADGLAALARGFALSLLDTQQQHERDISRLAPELHAVPNLFLLAIAAVESANAVYDRLQVYTDRMARNLAADGGAIMAESLMLLLAKRSGRKVWAHQRIHDLAMARAQAGGTLASVVAADPEVREFLSAADIEGACIPRNYIGTAVAQVDDAMAAYECRRPALRDAFERTVFSPAAAERSFRARP
jgi:adenylosuccinate lyase